MNALSLRVSSIKATQNLKKNSEIQISLLILPDKYMNISSSNDLKSHSTDVQAFLGEFTNGISVEQQLVSVKKLFSNLGNDLSLGTSAEVFGLLSEIYFLAPLKHPIRNIIAKNFEKLISHRPLIIESLVEAIITNVNKINDSSAVHEINKVVMSLDGCSENFQIGIFSLSHCFDEVFRILTLSINRFLKEIEKPNSPANLNEILIFLHSSIRLSLWYVQRCVSDRILDRATELTCLSNFCKNIIDCDHVPLDTKLNCGIFMVLNEIIQDNLSALKSRLTNADLTSRKDSIPVLCYCYGLCNTLASSQLLNKSISDFAQLVIGTLRIIADNYSNEQTILLGVCRALTQMTKSLLTISLPEIVSQVDLKDGVSMHHLVSQCLSFIWSYFEHHLDTVRHFCKDIFRNLLKLSHRNDDGYAFIRVMIQQSVVRNEISRNAQYMAVENLCQDMKVETIINSWPTIFEDLLIDLQDSKCLSCYQKLMTMHCKEVHVQSWYERWIQPLLCSVNKIDLQVMESLVNVAIKTHQAVTGYFLKEKEKLPLELYLFVVSTIRKNGLQLHCVPANDELIRRAKFHQTDDIRIMHLRIFVEVQKSTQSFTAGDLKEILEFLYYNSYCQSPAFRQKVVSFMTKAFNRIDASYPFVIKETTKETLAAYIGFLTKLKLLCTSNIFNGANFSRRSVSLNLLLQTITVSLKNNKISPPDIWTTELFEKIIKSLSDSYEANKVLAVDIIRLCPRNLVPHSHILNLEHLKHLVTSVKPTDCVTASYSLEYCCITGIHFNSYFDAVIWCEDILTEGLKVAQSSLLLAGRTNPLYGAIFCIRHLVAKVQLRQTFDPSWRDFVKRIVTLCKKLTNVVGPIVNSSSPEGHLPNDFTDVENFLPNECGSIHQDGQPNKILSSRAQASSDEYLTTTPQMLLLCAWRTVKEVSLLLGDLTLNSSIVDDTNRGLITVNEILDIGNHFHVLLSETKHRGAFEQAFVGFSKLCVRLWRAQESQLHQLPLIWLKDLLSIISGNEDSLVTNLKFDKICATRRSAGVPFMIQALLTSELQVCTNNGLKYSMHSLIEVCKCATMPEARTHALNILRALFRCTDLGDSIGEYISDGIECAIRGYSSNNWPERNSSTLLFSSLITRIFGVQRTKDSDNLNIRNKMTGRIFFLKYPRLFDFFFLELQSASGSIQKDELPSTLHPLLILLSRLYPSAVDGCESNLKLSSFLPLIAQCACSPEMGTRKLAVKSIVSLVPQYQILEYIESVIVQLQQQDNENKKMNSNIVHGNLLQIHHLMKSVDQKLFIENLSDFESITTNYLNLNILGSNNFILITVYVDTIIELFRRFGCKNINKFQLSYIKEFLSNILKTLPSRNKFIGLPLAIRSCLLLNLMINPDQREHLFFLENLSQRPYEYVDATLNIILLLLNNECPQDIFDQFEFESNERHFVDYIPGEEKCSLEQLITMSQPLSLHLKEIIKDETMFYPFCTIKAYTILSQLNLELTSVEELIGMLDRTNVGQIDDIKTSILKYVGAHLVKYFATMSEDDFVKILTYLREMAKPDGTDELRSTVSVVVCNISRKWTSITSLTLFSDIILLLLRDECLTIREYASKFVQNLLHKDFTPIVSSLAEEHFIEWLNAQFKRLNPEYSWNAWIQVIEIQLEKADVDNQYFIDDVFDKCESNSFGESVLVCKKIYRKIEQNLSESEKCADDIEQIKASFKGNWPELFEETFFSL